MERLEQMFQLQRELQMRLDTPLVGDGLRARGLAISDATPGELADLTKWHKEFSLALMMEASELQDWIPWKHWSKQLGNKQDVPQFSEHHRHEVTMEIVDCFHFLINISLMWGITPSQLFDIFSTKNEINHARQNSGSY